MAEISTNCRLIQKVCFNFILNWILKYMTLGSCTSLRFYQSPIIDYQKLF